MKTKLLISLGLLSHLSINSQCLTINCPSSITTTNVLSSCSAVVNYSTPIVLNNCGAAISTTLASTGAVQSFVVPLGVTSLTIEAWGAQGGANWVNNINYGGYTKGTFVVTPSQTLQVYVGSQATGLAGGFNGGGSGEGIGKGGGGASDVRISPYSLNDRVLVAGGAGGAGYWSSLHIVGGVGGGLVGGTGYRNTPIDEGGQGGTQTQSGVGTCASFSNAAVAGGFGFGGNVSGCGCEGYGGGGGYYGGAGSGNCRGGGGGSGYLLPTATNTVFTSGINIGNGKVVISYAGSSSTHTTSLISGLASGGSFPVGTTVQTYTVIDNLNNTNTCSFSVTVNDVQLPTITCPSNIASCTSSINSLAPLTFTDNCSASLTYSLTGATTSTGTGNANGLYNTGVTTVLYKALDLSGNTTTCSFSVTVNTTPTVSIANSNSLICVGQSVILTASGATTYTWSNTNITNSITVSPTITTVYTATGSVGNCTNTATYTQSVSACVGIDNINAISTGVFIYPNPTDGIINIDFNNTNSSGKKTVQVLNTLGETVLSLTVIEDKKTISLNLYGLATGLYFINIIENNGIIKTQKIMKQ
jgi:Glycine rich protein/Secretion system C-terminal sorting domain/HYR domain